MIALHLPGPESAALIVSALLVAADTTPHATEAADFRQLAHDLGDALDQLPTPHHGEPA